MNRYGKKKCCFVGHRKIVISDKLYIRVRAIIEDLIINKKVEIFFFGSRSEFNDLCHQTVSILKEKYPHIKRIYVRAEFAVIDDDYADYLLRYFEDTYYPQKLLRACKAAYVERNFEMIDMSDFCVICLDESYQPERRKNSRSSLNE